MKILVAHNYYKQAGGEDQCVAAEAALLKEHGHEVIHYSLHNDAIDEMSLVDAAARTVWNRAAFREVRELCRKHRPEIAHFHNTFPLISPAAYYAARAEGVRVVQTLHNFRLVCANALLFRNGEVCERCLHKFVPWQGIVHKCYRDSRAASTATAVMLGAHRLMGTWRHVVDRYIALTEFGRRILVEGGLPNEKISIKCNFVHPDSGVGHGSGGYGIFVGRLSAEKGVPALLEAWRQLGKSVPLKIVGDGPLASLVRDAAASNPAIEWLGSRPLLDVYRLIGDAAFLVLPSQCYESFGRVLIESFAKGTPVIVSRLGAMAEIVEDGRTGLHFASGDAADLGLKVRQMLAEPEDLVRMRQAARREFLGKFTADANHRLLIAIYEQALGLQLRGPELQQAQSTR